MQRIALVMFCKDCARFNSETNQCRDGKLNPQSWGQAVEVANQLGVRSICMFNDFRERLVESRHSPTIAISIQEPIVAQKNSPP